jgi:hypothetical protein
MAFSTACSFYRVEVKEKTRDGEQLSCDELRSKKKIEAPKCEVSFFIALDNDSFVGTLPETPNKQILNDKKQTRDKTGDGDE